MSYTRKPLAERAARLAQLLDNTEWDGKNPIRSGQLLLNLQPPDTDDPHSADHITLTWQVALQESPLEHRIPIRLLFALQISRADQDKHQLDPEEWIDEFLEHAPDLENADFIVIYTDPTN